MLAAPLTFSILLPLALARPGALASLRSPVERYAALENSMNRRAEGEEDEISRGIEIGTIEIVVTLVLLLVLCVTGLVVCLVIRRRQRNQPLSDEEVIVPFPPSRSSSSRKSSDEKVL
jgi:hypothetical protein